MEGPADPLARAYQPPADPTEPAAPLREPPSLDVRLVRLHLLVLAIAVVLLALVTAGMQLELWDPGPTLTAEAYNRSFTIHGAAIFTLLLPVLLGILPLLVLPGAGMRFPAWVAWPALGMWSAIVVPWWAWIDPFTGATQRLVATGFMSGVSCLYAVGLVLAVIGGRRPAFGRVAALGLVLGGVGAVLSTVLSLVQQILGPLPIAGPSLPDALLPVLVTMAVGLVEQQRGTTVANRRFAVAFAVLLLGLSVIYGLQAALTPRVEADLGAGLSNLMLSPVLLYVLFRVARPVLTGLPEPASLAVLLALVSMAGLGLTWRFLGMLSQDVHLHDTWFALVPLHLAGAATLLLLVAACFQWSPALLGRTPRRFMGIAGVLGLGGGMLVSFVAMAMLGQQGMPRRYYVYVPQFQSLHQWVGVGGLVTAVGLALIVVAIATGRRRSGGANHPAFATTSSSASP